MIVVGILDHQIFPEDNNIISHYLFTNTKTKQTIPNNYLEFDVVELTKFNKELDQLQTQADNRFNT